MTTTEKNNRDFINLAYKLKQNSEAILSYYTVFTVLYKEAEDGYYSCYIPSYEIAFTASSFDEIDGLSESIIRSFYVQWMRNNGIEKLIKELGNLKFSIDGENVIKNDEIDKINGVECVLRSLNKIPLNYQEYNSKRLTQNNNLITAPNFE